MQLSQKEKDIIKDLIDEEKLCVEKYTKHSSCANDSQLKNLFSQIAQIEQSHLDSVTQLSNGVIPQQNGNSPQPQSNFSATYSAMDNNDQKKNDAYLCSDILATEKHASHLYDTCIFEFKDASARSLLNHIQKEEQNHGKLIYDYMQTNSMY